MSIWPRRRRIQPTVRETFTHDNPTKQRFSIVDANNSFLTASRLSRIFRNHES